MYANVDIEAVGRILKNLIDNAIKYGNAGKFLGISLYKKDNHIYIEVEDHGAGISEKDKIREILKFYDAYICKLCLRPLYHSESGKITMQVDEELKGQIYTEMMKAILKFEIREK